MNNIDEYSDKLGKRIARSRKELDFTQKQLAEKLGISQQLMANYELGQRRIHVYLLIKIANALHTSVDTLLGMNKKNKRGPVPKIQMRIEQIQKLPLQKQKMILEFLDSFIKREEEEPYKI
jgi:transcriptional regulator with XRE-family HTH domain